MQWIAIKDKIKENDKYRWKEEEFAFLIFQTLIQKTVNNNCVNNIFLKNFKNWYINNLIKYKNRLIWEWKWWDPSKDKETFNKILLKIFKIIFKKVFFKWNINKWSKLDIHASMYIINKFCFENNKEKKIGLEKIPINTSPDFFNEIIIDLWESQEFFIPIINLEENWLSISFMIFTILNELNAIPKSDIQQTKRYVEFVSISTYNAYDYAKDLYESSHKTILWISSYLKAQYIYDYFSKNHDRTKPLTNDVLKSKIVDNRWNKTTIEQLTEKRKQTVQKSLINYENAEKTWYIIDSDYWPFILDYNLKIPNWPEIATYKEKNLLKIFESWDIFLYFPNWIWSWLQWKIERLWNMGWEKSFFIKIDEKNYVQKIVQLLKIIWFDSKTIKTITKICKTAIKGFKDKKIKNTIKEQENQILNLTIESLGKENKSLIMQLKQYQKINFTNNKSINWVIIKKIKYWTFIDIWWIIWLLHKNTCWEDSSTKSIWEIVSVNIVWIIVKNEKINLELELNNIQ